MKRVIISNFLIGVLSVLLLVPFVMIVFFIRSEYGLAVFLIILGAAFLTALLFIVYCIIERRKYFRLATAGMIWQHLFSLF